MDFFSLLQKFEGTQTIGKGKGFWSAFFVCVIIACIYPIFTDSYDVGNTAYFLTSTFMAMGLCVLWGYTGNLSFGNTVFYGIAGYAYGVLTINIGSAYGFTFVAVILGLVLVAIFALILGYFLFYGRISGVFLGIVTLSVMMVVEKFLSQTAGPEWAIGSARLNGYNGMTAMPPLTLPWFGGDIMLYPDKLLYYVLLVLMIMVYLALRWLVNSRFGNVLVAIRENPLRAEMLGYDIRKYQMAAFIISAILAGLSGSLYTAWGQYITPSSMGMAAAALPIIWVAIGGRSDLTATLIGTFFVLILYQYLTVYGSQYATIVMGVLMILIVLFAPKGLVLLITDYWSKMRNKQLSKEEGF